MGEQRDRAHELGQQAGEEVQGVLPVVGDALEGLWDGLLLNAPDETGGTYTTAYEVGSAIPGLLLQLWRFVEGFFAGLFG